MLQFPFWLLLLMPTSARLFCNAYLYKTILTFDHNVIIQMVPQGVRILPWLCSFERVGQLPTEHCSFEKNRTQKWMTPKSTKILTHIKVIWGRGGRNGQFWHYMIYGWPLMEVSFLISSYKRSRESLEHSCIC